MNRMIGVNTNFKQTGLILKTSSNLEKIDNIVHRIKPVRCHWTSKASDTIQVLQLTNCSKSQNVNQTGTRIAADEHRIRILIRLIEFIRILNSFSDLHTNHRNGMIGGGGVGHTKSRYYGTLFIHAYFLRALYCSTKRE